jgi:hypothetical protein
VDFPRQCLETGDRNITGGTHSVNASIRTVTLLMTICGTERPNVAVWDALPLLSPLSLSHSREAFTVVATDLEPHGSLDNLVDCVPLAVSLLARRSQITGESVATVWRHKRIIAA